MENCVSSMASLHISSYFQKFKYVSYKQGGDVCSTRKAKKNACRDE